MLKKFIKKLIYPHNYSSEAYVNYLRNKGIKIGSNTYFFNPRKVQIDVSRPEFIEIGDNCKITTGVTILAHDYSYSVLRSVYHEILPTSAITKIGDNVFIGINSTILMGSTIGDNVIIGAGSVVTGNVPSNTIFAGNPARQISTIDNYYNKLKANIINNAKLHAKRIKEVKHRNPTLDEMGYYTWLFTDYKKDKFNAPSVFYGDDTTEYIKDYTNMKTIYKDFNKFLSEI